MTFNDPNAALYRQGPLARFGEDADDGWHSLPMEYIQQLIAFAAGSCEIATVQSIVYGSLLAADVSIDSVDEVDKKQAADEKKRKDAPEPKPSVAGMERPNKSEALQPLPAREQAANRERSRMWIVAAISSLKQDDAIGFRCNATVKGKPCVLQLDKVSKIMHRVDVFGQHDWKFYHRVEAVSLDEVLIPNVTVTGSELPDASGRLNSKVIRLLNGAWALYNDKLQNTQRADRERANPTLVTVEDPNATKKDADPKMIGSHIGISETGAPISVPYQLSAAQAAQAMAVADSVSLHNCLNSGSHPLAPRAANPRKRKEHSQGGFTEYELTLGRIVAANHMPEAPADVLPAKQAWLETVCLSWCLPMSLVSSGDATGKAKLNAATASSDTSRLYLESQAARKREIEGWISEMHSRIHGESAVRKLVSKKLAEKQEEPSLEEMNDHSTVLVNISGQIEAGQLQSLHQEGSLKYPSYVNYMARITGLSSSDFNTQPLVSVEDAAGVPVPAPPEPAEGGAAAAGGASKKKKKKKAKTASSK